MHSPAPASSPDAATEIAAWLGTSLARERGDARAALWQEGLDLLAVVAGIKPISIVMGKGAEIDRIAARAGLARALLPRWAAAGPLPDWYEAAHARWRARHPLLHVARGGAMLAAAAALAAKGRVTPEEEADVLGYPVCCVATEHRRAIALETLVAEMAERAAAGDDARKTRMIEAGAMPLPVTAEHIARFAALAAVTPSPATSVNLCAGCAAEPASPARRLDAAYAALAARTHYPAR